MSSAPRSALYRDLETALREASAQSILISHAVSNATGLGMADLECLDLVVMRGPVTAGELAKVTGLTTGAITGLIDRLEKAGYVERADDPEDRRRVLVKARMDHIKRIADLYKPLLEQSHKLFARYTAKEIEIMIDFNRRSRVIAAGFIAQLKNPAG